MLVLTMYVTEAGWSGWSVLCLFSLCMLQRRDGGGGWFCALVFTMYVTEAGWSGRLVLCACFHYVCYRGGMEWEVGSVCLF